MRFLMAFAGAFVALAVAAAEPPIGLFSSSLEAHGAAEEAFLETPTPAKARQWLARLTEEPHVAGTPQERQVAEYVRERLEEFGLETEVVSYEVFLNHPRAASLTLVEPETHEISLTEEPISGDKDSGRHLMFPAFHGYGASGSAAGQVVYANYGTRADFERLASMGVSVEGRIALVRYGSVFRGLKVREAEAAGAAGVVIYSDPADDGYMRGDVYPDGPMRPPSAIQRGSVQFLSIQPGDPSTPGWPSRDDARRLTRDEMRTVPGIPSLPISYGEAERILRHLGGERVPDEWQGGLPFAYHVGPGTAVLEMSVEMDEGLKTIYNVFGRIRGSEKPERMIVMGNHRDAWTHGAVDPNSGTAVMLEAARGMAAAVRAGWRPRRTIVLASWDAEEYGLVGSVEWGEDRAAELGEAAVAYINVDGAVTGDRFSAAGSPSLRDLVRQVAGEVRDPLRQGSVGTAWERRLEEAWAENAPVQLDRPDEAFELHLPPLGSGSDYTVFLDHLGVPSVHFGFGGRYGVYHSVYDNFQWMERFGDPRFVYHAAAARFYGLLGMRLASAELVPYRFGSYARSLTANLDQLRRRVIRDARRPSDPAAAEGEASFAPDFAPVLAALGRLEQAGAAMDRRLDAAVAAEDAAAASRLNEELIAVERAFLDPEGLPGRPWFRHLLYAPGTTTGYAPWPFPELTEAVEERDQARFETGTRRVVAVLESAARVLEEAAAGP